MLNLRRCDAFPVIEECDGPAVFLNAHAKAGWFSILRGYGFRKVSIGFLLHSSEIVLQNVSWRLDG